MHFQYYSLFSDSIVTLSDEDMVHIPSGRGEPKFVCGKHMKDIVNLPKNFKDFFLSQQQQFNPGKWVFFIIKTYTYIFIL